MDAVLAIRHPRSARQVRQGLRTGLSRLRSQGCQRRTAVVQESACARPVAQDSNLRHRPVGMGIMGFQDCLHMMRVPYASNAAVEFADRSMEAVCYYSYLASTELAEERGRYSSYEGSLWDRGILPQDSLKLLAEERGGYLE